MTKYQLKDSDLQHHLDAISDGDFTDVLNANDLKFDEDGMTDIAFGSSIHGKTFIAEKFSVTLLKDEIIFQYDPNAWNSFPEVTPPEGVRMRVEKKGNELRSSLRNFESQNEYGYKPCIKRRFQNAETLQSRNQTNSS